MDADYWSVVGRRRLSRRQTLAVTGGAVGGAVLAACGGDGGSPARRDASGVLTRPEDTTKRLKRGGVLRLSHDRDAQTFDPHFTSAPTQFIIGFVASRLVRGKPGYLEPSRLDIDGDVARSWELSPDKLQLTLKLHPEARWHPIPPLNNRSLDAEDVVFTWERYAAQGTNRSTYANAVSPEAPITSVKAVDARTVAIRLVRPEVSFLHLLAAPQMGNLFLVPREAEGALDVRRQMVGAGPFYLAQYEPSVRYTLKKTPNYRVDERDLPYVDEVSAPIVTEQNARLAQMRTGAIYYVDNVSNEDALSMQSDQRELSMYATAVAAQGLNVVFGLANKSPFNDERVRQAFSMSWDRDLSIEVDYGVERLTSQGIGVETRWSSALSCADTYEGWWLDPKGKDFGPNAKYFQHDLGEARKLLRAAGFSGGVDFDVFLPTSGLAPGWIRGFEVVLGMSNDAGFRGRIVPVNFNTEYKPLYQLARGNFAGMTVTGTFGGPEPGNILSFHYHRDGPNFSGYSPNGAGPSTSGDPLVNDLTAKMRLEFLDKKRQELAFELQRYLGKTMYQPRMPGGASGIEVVWPILRNWRVWQGDSGRSYATVWIDDTLPPAKS